MNTPPKITVANVRKGLLRDHNLHLYCGRGKAWPATIGANIGNPFRMKNQSEVERNRICDEYHEMLLGQPDHPHMKIIQRMALRLHEGKSIALYCFCAPKRCHCDSIRSFALAEAEKLKD